MLDFEITFAPFEYYAENDLIEEDTVEEATIAEEDMFNFIWAAIRKEKMVEMVRENFDLRPAGIIKMLDLRRPIYKQTAAYGHFGRTDLDLPWEKTDKAEILKSYL